MSDAHHLDPAMARSDFERCVIELRNDGDSWPTTARTMGCSVSIVRKAWARANAHQRGDLEADTPLKTSRPDSFLGHEDLLRGIPMTGFGGAITGTRPGDRPQRRMAS